MQIRLLSPFVLRSTVLPVSEAHGKTVMDVERKGKRIVLALEAEVFLVIHLMIAGRLKWTASCAQLPGRITLAAFNFAHGMLAFTEAGSKKRASLHIVRGKEALSQFDLGGLEVLDADPSTFAIRLTAENHTVKRALTDPRIFSGIGNAYSDEILHRARLSPIIQTRQLDEQQIVGLYRAARAVLTEWTARLQAEAGEDFPRKVTAFRPGMAVHGRFGRPCPRCGSPVQRIVYAENETNYCARCQTGGRLLADRALSRLLKQSWPRSIDELG
jgi:formamidopyrimidine-DNA glycosylase